MGQFIAAQLGFRGPIATRMPSECGTRYDRDRSRIRCANALPLRRSGVSKKRKFNSARITSNKGNVIPKYCLAAGCPSNKYEYRNHVSPR
jgi:hypothetical protein